MAPNSPDLGCWIDVALGDAAWTAALDVSAALLGANDVGLGLAPKPGMPGRVYYSGAASSGFQRFCHELLDAYGAEAVQSRTTSEGQLMWVHASSSAWQIQDVAIFAQWSRKGDAVLLHRIASMAARAVAARRQISEMRAALALRNAAFDRLPFGVAMVDDALYLSEPNAACRRILQRADGVFLHQERLSCRVETDGEAVWDAIKSTLQRPGGEAPAVHVARSGGATPYVVAPVVGAGVNVGHCLLVIIDPEDNDGVGNETWRALTALGACEFPIGMSERLM